MVDTDRRRTPWQALAFPTRARTPDRWDAVASSAVQMPPGRSATGQLNSKDTAKAGLATAATRQRQGDTPPSKARLGALLSSDDFGSSVERTAKLHPLCRVANRRAGVGAEWCAC